VCIRSSFVVYEGFKYELLEIRLGKD